MTTPEVSELPEIKESEPVLETSDNSFSFEI